MSESNETPRQKAARARAEQLAKEKRRDLLIKIIGGVVVLAVVVGIIAIALVSRSGSSGGDPAPDPSAASPTGVDPATYGYIVNPQAPTNGVPQVAIWEDFQCPGCKSFETVSMPAVLAEAKAGRINLQLRPTIFLDAQLGNTASALATNAWGCAINAGKGLEYHSAVFADQPDSEGVGYTQQQLLDIGKEVGITGDAFTSFETCVNNKTFNGWVGNSQQQFIDAAVPGTPAIYVNGKELNNARTANGFVYSDPAALIKAINEAAQ